ncbi:MAG: hypothetical protein IPG77_04375 [Betaproteobacteria bacterium]|nr:hypothetical protein [Betaproteobacteria bacterium]
MSHSAGGGSRVLRVASVGFGGAVRLDHRYEFRGRRLLTDYRLEQSGRDILSGGARSRELTYQQCTGAFAKMDSEQEKTLLVTYFTLRAGPSPVSPGLVFATGVSVGLYSFMAWQTRQWHVQQRRWILST